MYMKKIRIGIFGLSRGFNNRKAIMLNDAEIVAICDKKKRFRDRAARELGNDVKVFSDFDEFIKTDMDAVYLANYFPEHTPYAIKCFERNIHVISECISNGTMAEGVELVRAFEKSRSVYMLAENYPYMLFNQEMQKVYASGVLGKALYAEGEYNHPGPGNVKDTVQELYDSEEHWRAYLPRTYYVTHSLGPLMMATKAEPVSVCALPVNIGVDEISENDDVISAARFNDKASIMITRNNDGSVFRFVGHSSFGAKGNTYRVAGTKGQIENVRGTDGKVMLNFNEWQIPEGYEEHNFYFPKEDEAVKKLAEQTGHAGGDFYMFRDFFDCIRTGRRPYFDVYVATKMSSVAILAHRSQLEGGKPYEIPDFRKEEDRVKWQDDRISPFYTYGKNEPSIRCCSDPTFTQNEGRLARFRAAMKEVEE